MWITLTDSGATTGTAGTPLQVNTATIYHYEAAATGGGSALQTTSVNSVFVEETYSERAVILIPYRSDGGRRDELAKFTNDWLWKHHPRWPRVLGYSPEGPFNRGAAINDAARMARDWDVAVVSDADNICDPATLQAAVEQAHETKGCVFPYDTYLYLDESSSDRLIAGDYWFVTPVRQAWGINLNHHSGIQAISRAAYDQVGGFPEMEGWGYEDSVMAEMLKAFTPGIKHLQGSAYHLYHGEGSSNPERAVYGPVNQQILADVMALSVVPDQLREYLKAGGHPIP